METETNTKTCTTCHQPVKRYNAVIRGDAHQQNYWHPVCFTIHRATQDVDAAGIVADHTEAVAR